MLAEYFSMVIDDAGKLRELPILLKSYEVPIEADHMVSWFVQLESQVNWKEEKACIKDIAKRLAQLYQFKRVERQEFRESLDGKSTNAKLLSHQWSIEHAFFPALKQEPLFPSMYKAYVTHLTDSKDLYKVFERC